jgi:hypothetical protein
VRCIGGVAERLAQPLDRGVQTLFEVDEGVGRPQLGAQLLARDEPAGLLEQADEQAKRLLLEGDSATGLAQLSGLDVHLEHAEANRAIRRVEHWNALKPCAAGRSASYTRRDTSCQPHSKVPRDAAVCGVTNSPWTGPRAAMDAPSWNPHLGATEGGGVHVEARGMTVIVSLAFAGTATAQPDAGTQVPGPSSSIEAALEAAIGILPERHRPQVPLIVVDPSTASRQLLRMSRRACAFVLEPARSVIFVRADCPALVEYLRSGDRVALMVVAALVAHENAHVDGAGELEARRVEMAVFSHLTANSHPSDRKRALHWIAAAGARRTPRR